MALATGGRFGGMSFASGGAVSTSSGGGSSSGGSNDSSGGSGGDPLTGSGGLIEASGGVATGGAAQATGGSSSGGATASGGAMGSGGGLPGCAAADILCEQFESYAGARPSGGIWKDDPCANTGYLASTDAGAGPDGSAAYVTKGASTGTNYCVLTGDLGDQLTDFWVSAAVQIGGSNPDMEHELTFFELGAVEGDDPELRVGYRGDSSCAVQGFELGATAGPGGEFTGCTGNKPLANQWYCLEVHVDQSGGSIVSQLSVDGEPQTYNVHGMMVPDVLGSFQARFLKVGLQSYGGEFESLALDNLSVSTSRVGCD